VKSFLYDSLLFFGLWRNAPELTAASPGPIPLEGYMNMQQYKPEFPRGLLEQQSRCPAEQVELNVFHLSQLRLTLLL
jgi:hypothetical protein